ncbi:MULTISPECIES: PqqD family protein [unclassified Microbacterium]|uniref:PqqD family protein n=1 Tax=unclassified Microbacterium TaxID=2609290 RepID=UPI001E4A1953|nr:PqqD family protein [Microbacterium sp. Au-Mic1]MCE4027336.1 PqqD family protein [Microbacterium sp. Au-Mic1]
MGGEQTAQWRIADAVAWTISGNDVVALDLESSTAHPMTLQETAAYIWEEIAVNSPISTNSLVTNVADAYEVGEEIVRDDVLALLDELRDRHLIRRTTSAGI